MRSSIYGGGGGLGWDFGWAQISSLQTIPEYPLPLELQLLMENVETLDLTKHIILAKMHLYVTL